MQHNPHATLQQASADGFDSILAVCQEGPNGYCADNVGTQKAPDVQISFVRAHDKL